MSPFDILNALGKKLYTKEEVDSCLGINLIINYLRNSPVTINLAEWLNRHYKLSVYQMYLLAYYSFPKGLSIRWITTTKNVKDEDVEMIQEYFVCSKQTATEYLSLLSESDFKRIKRLYQFGSKGKK